MARDAPQGGRSAGRRGEGVEIRLPEGVPWPVHRVATSRRYTDSLHTILTEWSLADVWTANAVLDAIEDAERRQQEEAARGG